MKLSEYKNEDAIEVLCDILEPTATILADEEMRKAVNKGCNNITAVKLAIKNHSKEVIQILARLDGIEVKDANYNVITITTKLLEILNDKEFTDFFLSQGQITETSSISAMPSTKAKGK